MTEFELQLDNFMLYCSSKNLSTKTLKSYDQTLKLFLLYMGETYQVEEAGKVKSVHIRQYIKYLRERGKHTVASTSIANDINRPHNRTDYKKPLSDTTIANYLRNIKVFFNFLFQVEREIKTNPVESIQNIKPKRKQKPLLTEDEIIRVLEFLTLLHFMVIVKRWLLYRDRYSNSDYMFPTIRGTQLEVRNFEKIFT
ncbi:site-specific integrase [Bacillus pseudomycoides]|uniref:Site-specific integrase n=1 Tax=Bacillus bingmayongensis TaxID=1150157 RepID=A0ABU5K1K2_9BACI|nr:site-specific integrase [Bacillus pseudomycoides]